MRRLWNPAIVLPLAMAAGVVAFPSAQPFSASPSAGVSRALSAGGDERGPADEAARRRLLGVWQDDYKGRRTMTLNEDGTGTMLVELSGAQALLFASRLRFDMEWSFDGDKLTKQTVGGEPAVKVGLILRTMGDTAVETVVELTDERLLLLDKDGKTRYDWRRLEKPSSGAVSP